MAALFDCWESWKRTGREPVNHEEPAKFKVQETLHETVGK